MSRAGGKKVLERLKRNGPEGKALLECFTSGNFDINDHDAEDIKTSNDVFDKFDTSQIKASIRKLQQNVYSAGTMEDQGK